MQGPAPSESASENQMSMFPDPSLSDMQKRKIIEAAIDQFEKLSICDDVQVCDECSIVDSIYFSIVGRKGGKIVCRVRYQNGRLQQELL